MALHLTDSDFRLVQKAQRALFPSNDCPGTALAIPARANVLPSAEHIQAATDLSPREADVARHLAEGKTDRAIAEHFGISPYTVRRHTGSILTKLDLSSRGGVALALLWACAARQSNRPIPTAATVSHRTGPLPTPTAPFK